MFPILRERADIAAADLSGGQQQMLALGMAFVTRPRVLLVDELSLGLAPVVVAQMLPIIQRLAADGVAVVLVEQSVNVALTVAERAYFMERGRIRFSGPTAELLERSDLLRSVFLSGVVSGGEAEPVIATPDGAGAVALSVDGLVRRFGGIRAVDGASFDVHEREIVGLIGPNGAGKTTIFDLVSGFIPVDAGRVVLGGRDITSASPSARARAGLGRSFQDGLLFPEMTVFEALEVANERWVRNRSAIAAALRLPRAFDDEERTAMRAEELMELMVLTSYRTSFVRELSTGTRRILDLACQVAHRPTVILLDEPSSGIAQREAEALAPVLRRLRDEMGAALVVIEHDIPLVSSIADRLVALDMGRVIAAGEPASRTRRPARRRVLPRHVSRRHREIGSQEVNEMQPASAGEEGGGSGRAWRRWGPIAAIVAVVAIVAGVLVATSGGGGDDDDDAGAATTAGDTAPATTTGASAPGRPEVR